ncbi:MAG: D-alanine--D-alanine ligase [Oscillospiraceae bacterium]|nr:D-alanine--D-alanine ligase [Oscillospiraceae bacterium]
MKELCVVFGGQSPEHEISRKSVTSVLRNLDKSKYNISLIGITKNGAWYLYTGDYDKIESGAWEEDTANKKKAVISPDAEDKAIIVFDGDKTDKVHIDVIFPVLHGEYGEDGTIQGLFELSNIPYVGMGVMASANSMDKTSSKIVFQNAGIPQADWVVVNKTDDFEEKMNEIETKLGYPCFVKPARTGSSVGVGKAHDRTELKDALNNAAQFDRKILVEENIDGHEVECAILGNDDPKATTVGEIMPTVEFYDFDAKYNDNSTKLQIPADIPAETIELIQGYAIKAFKALDGSGLSRVDFFVKYSDGSVVLNEINTLPGFTNISMYPKLWDKMGIEYGRLLDNLIELAEKRVK